MISFLIDMSQIVSKDTAEAVHPEILSGFDKLGYRSQMHLLLWCRKCSFCHVAAHVIEVRTEA